MRKMKYPKRVIKKGEDNARIVKAVQARLNETGCGPLEVDGDFGPMTFTAVKLFQSTHRDQLGNPLEIDGKVGAITWAVLFGVSMVPTLEHGATPLLSEALRVAASQVGIMESPVGSNRGPEVDGYLKSVGLGPGYYWCAAFAYWCFDQAARKLGRPNPVFKTAGCMNHWNKTKGKKIQAAEAVENPSLLKPGQIFIINLGRGSGHTGIIEKVEGGFLQTIEGNSNPAGSSNGIGVFRLERKIVKINQGFIEYR
jgi:hypothetical protein